MVPVTESAWIAEDDEGWARLRREEEFIAKLAAVGCRVPRVIRVDEHLIPAELRVYAVQYQWYS